MLKKVIILSAVAVLPASALAGDVRTLYPAGTIAQQHHANGGGAVNRRASAPYALTGERRAERYDNRQQAAVRRFNWQAGSANFRPGK